MASSSKALEQVGERDDQRSREGAIGSRILGILGEPSLPCSVRVRRLWDGHYRVNVLIGEVAAFARIAHSYFVSADAEGNIIASNPPVKKQY